MAKGEGGDVIVKAARIQTRRDLRQSLQGARHINPLVAALALSCLMLMAELGHAQGVKPEDQMPARKRWTLILGLGQSQSLYVTNDGHDQASTDMSLAARFRLAPKTLLTVSAAGSYDNKAKESDLTTAALSLSQSQIPLSNDRLLWTPSLSFQLPASRASLATSMKYAFGLSNRFDLSSEKMGWTHLSIAYLASVSHSFFEYETSVSGAVNQPLKLSQGLELSWALNDQVFLVGFISQGLRQSIFGHWQESFTHSEELYAQINPQLGLSIGHQLGAPIRAANGQDLNLRLSSEQESVAYMQMTVTL